VALIYHDGHILRELTSVRCQNRICSTRYVERLDITKVLGDWDSDCGTRWANRDVVYTQDPRAWRCWNGRSWLGGCDGGHSLLHNCGRRANNGLPVFERLFSLYKAYRRANLVILGF